MSASHPIPLAALAHHVGIVGKTGSGKTFAAKGAVEGLLARGERTLVIDPTGVWWGLRLRSDGKRASEHAPVIFGGRHGDLPLVDKDAAETGERLAVALGGSATPAIVDLQQMSVAARTRLATSLFEGLLRENRGPLTLVLDEAHLFAPQSGAGAGNFETTALLHATNNLVALGRSAGLRIMMITQRPAKLHKDSLSQVECMVALRLVDPRDRKAVEDWLDGAPDPSRGAEIMASLASLPTGTGWIYAPEIGVLERAVFPAIATFDSGRPLEAGEMPELKPIDVGALREAMSISAPSKEAAKTDTAKKATAPSIERQASAAELAAAEQRGFGKGVIAGVRVGWTNARTGMLRHLEGHTATFPQLPDADFFDAMVETASERGAASWTSREKTSALQQRQSPRADEASAPTPPAESVTLSPSLQRVLDALGWWRAARFPIPMVPRGRAAVTAGYSPKASTFGVYISDLVKRGLVATGAGTVGLTEAGVVCADVPAHVTVDDLRASARALLKPQEARAFDVIYAAGGRPIRRDDVAIALGLSTTASTAGVYISAVTAYRLIEPAGRGEVRAVPWLFEVRRR